METHRHRQRHRKPRNRQARQRTDSRPAREGVEAPQKVTVSRQAHPFTPASALAAAELPDYDVTVRGAVSIARRLQDPLAELVKIDPQSIGVGQYQHDVPPAALRRALNDTVEDCVNAVGVNLNNASRAAARRTWRAWGPRPPNASLTTGPSTAPSRTVGSCWTCRDWARRPSARRRGSFASAAVRSRWMPRGAPEACPLARRIIADAQARNGAHWVAGALGTSDGSDPLAGLNPADYVQNGGQDGAEEGTVGVTRCRISSPELRRPGLDPRGSFRTARFSESVSRFEDVRPGMVLEGTVSNVAAFGAFVDIGVHQDGLVHISQMSRGYVANPHDIVRKR